MNTTSFTDGSTLPQIITETSVREGKESTSASEGVSWGGGGGGGRVSNKHCFLAFFIFPEMQIFSSNV